MPHRIFFFHNPKAGGTSVVDALSGLFPRERRCPRIENDATEHRLRDGRYEMFRGYDFYAGHYGFDIYRGVGERIPAVTNFRWPVDRVVSLYRYFRHMVEISDDQAKDPRFLAVALSKRLSLDDFVTCDEPAVRLHTCDHHYRQLTGSGWSSERLQTLDDARALLDRMAWFYVCELPEESMVWARSVFAGRLPELARLNVTRPAEPGEDLLGRAAHRRLILQNQNDISIYQHGLDRLMAENLPERLQRRA